MDKKLLYNDLLKALDKATPSTWEEYQVLEEDRSPLPPPPPLKPGVAAWPKTAAQHGGGSAASHPPKPPHIRIIKRPRRSGGYNEAYLGEVPVAVKSPFPDEANTKRLTLDNLRRERLNQVRATFTTAIATLILGILLVFTGVVLALTFNLSLGVVTTISSTVVGLISGLSFKFHTDANRDLDKIIKQLIIVEQTSLATELIEKISDKKLQNDALIDLIKYVRSSVPNSL